MVKWLSLQSGGQWGLFIKSSRAKRWGTPKSARNIECTAHAVKWMQSVPSTESSFSVQTSRVAGRLPFFRVEPEFDIYKSHSSGVAPGCTNRREKWTASSCMGTLVDGRRTHVQLRLCGIDKYHRNRPPRVKVRPFHGLRMTVAKGRNFESSSRGHQGSSRNLPFDSCFALCKCAGWHGMKL